MEWVARTSELDGEQGIYRHCCPLPPWKAALAGGKAGFGGAEMRLGDDPTGLPRVAEAKADLDEPVAAEARGHRERHAGVDDLEVGQLEAPAAPGDLLPGGEGGRTKLGAERGAGLG